MHGLTRSNHASLLEVNLLAGLVHTMYFTESLQSVEQVQKSIVPG